LRPPLRCLLDLAKGSRRDADLARRSQPNRRNRSSSCSPDTNSPRSI
jgi:hypothetical protein